MAEILELRDVAKAKAPRKKAKTPAPAARAVSAKTARRTVWQLRSALLLGTVASAMTVVSLTHVAGGVQMVTHDAVPWWQAWGLGHRPECELYRNGDGWPGRCHAARAG
jgi:hypothetical protein